MEWNIECGTSSHDQEELNQLDNTASPHTFIACRNLGDDQQKLEHHRITPHHEYMYIF